MTDINVQEQTMLESNISESIVLDSNTPDNTSDSNISELTVSDNNIIPEIITKQKAVRTKFEKTCGHCNKVLKSAKTYEHHVNNQVCYNKNETTFCKVCKITCSNRPDYVKHLLSMEHINKIGCQNLETLNNNQPSTILQIDPFLTNNEAKSIGTNNLGNKFTFVFQNNRTQTIDLINNDNQNNNPIGNNNLSGNNNINNLTSAIAHNTLNQVIIDGQSGNRKIEPTVKQQKILSILENAKSIEDGCKLLLRMLDNKLNLEDYHGLQSIIRNDSNMQPELNTAYIEIIDKFVSMLVKRRTNGETVYKDKDISKIVISLTI